MFNNDSSYAKYPGSVHKQQIPKCLCNDHAVFTAHKSHTVVASLYHRVEVAIAIATFVANS